MLLISYKPMHTIYIYILIILKNVVEKIKRCCTIDPNAGVVLAINRLHAWSINVLFYSIDGDLRVTVSTGPCFQAGSTRSTEKQDPTLRGVY